MPVEPLTLCSDRLTYVSLISSPAWVVTQAIKIRATVSPPPECPKAKHCCSILCTDPKCPQHCSAYLPPPLPEVFMQPEDKGEWKKVLGSSSADTTDLKPSQFWGVPQWFQVQLHVFESSPATLYFCNHVSLLHPLTPTPQCSFRDPLTQGK